MFSHVAQGWLLHSLHILLVQHQTDISLDSILLPIMISLAFPPNLSCLAIGQSAYWLEHRAQFTQYTEIFYNSSFIDVCVNWTNLKSWWGTHNKFSKIIYMFLCA